MARGICGLRIEPLSTIKYFERNQHFTSVGESIDGCFDLVLSVSGDKELDDVLRPLLEASGRGRIVTTRAEPARSLPADWLAKRIDELAERLGMGWGAISPLAIEDPDEAMRVARAQLEPGRMLCAAGSVYLAGIARRVLGGSPVQGGVPRR